MKVLFKHLFLICIPASLMYFLIGWLVFDLILGPFSNANTTQLPGFKKNETEFSFLFLFLSCLAYALLLNFIQHLQQQISSPYKIFFIAAIIGVLIACMTDFYWFASSHFYLNFFAVIADIAGAAITVGLLGLTIFFLRKKFL